MAANVRPNIIDTDFTVDKMINIFSSKGLSVHDLVVLSGTLSFLIFKKERSFFKTNLQFSIYYGSQERTLLELRIVTRSTAGLSLIQKAT